MNRWSLARRIAAAALVLGVTALPGSVEAAGNVSQGLRVVGRVAAHSGTDIAFEGNRVYLGHLSGGTLTGSVTILDTSKGRLEEAGSIGCGAGQTDVATLGKGIIAIGNHSGICGNQTSYGINLFDATDATAPKQLGFWTIPNGSHTLTAHPTKPYIYTSDSGYLVDTRTHIIDVSDPAAPRGVATERFSCHDISFRITKRDEIAFCAVGGNSTGIQSAIEIWDVRNPIKPVVVDRIEDRGLAYPHTAVATPDGRYLVVSDEARPSDCNSPEGPRDYGALSIYDLEAPTSPELVGYINVPRGTASCWAHNFNFIPGTRTLVTSWYDGGMGVYDLSDPSRPVETAFFRPDDRRMWSAYWHRGRIYASSRDTVYVLELTR